MPPTVAAASTPSTRSTSVSTLAARAAQPAFRCVSTAARTPRTWYIHARALRTSSAPDTRGTASLGDSAAALGTAYNWNVGCATPISSARARAAASAAASWSRSSGDRTACSCLAAARRKSPTSRSRTCAASSSAAGTHISRPSLAAAAACLSAPFTFSSSLRRCAIASLSNFSSSARSSAAKGFSTSLAMRERSLVPISSFPFWTALLHASVMRDIHEPDGAAGVAPLVEPAGAAPTPGDLELPTICAGSSSGTSSVLVSEALRMRSTSASALRMSALVSSLAACAPV